MSYDPAAPTPTAEHRRLTDGRVRATVFAATLRELTTVGYETLSLSAVAARAGVARHEMFRTWRSKQHLVLAALHHLAADVGTSDTGDLRTDLLAHVDALTAVLGHPGATEVLSSLIVAAQRSPAATTTLRTGPIAERRVLLRRTLERAQREGRCPPFVDPRVAADAVVGHLCYRLLIARESLRDVRADLLVDLVLGVHAARVDHHAGHHHPGARSDHHTGLDDDAADERPGPPARSA